MDDPSFAYTEIRAPGAIARRAIPLTSLRSTLVTLGSRPTDVHVGLCRYDKSFLTHIRDTGKAAGFKGPSKADYAVVEIDGDVAGEGNLDESIRIRDLVVSMLAHTWGIKYEWLAVYYSGSRGFHIMVPLSLFGGIPAHAWTNRAMFDLVIELFEPSGMIARDHTIKDARIFRSDGIDLQVYTPLHMLRCPATIHPTTDLWKVPLREGEGKTADEVREIGAEKRAPYRPAQLFPHLTVNDARAALGDVIRSRMENGEFRAQRVRDAGTALEFNSITTHQLEDLQLPGFGRYAAQGRQILDLLRGGFGESEERAGVRGRRSALRKLAQNYARYRVPYDQALFSLVHWNNSHAVPLERDEFERTVQEVYQEAARKP